MGSLEFPFSEGWAVLHAFLAMQSSMDDTLINEAKRGIVYNYDEEKIYVNDIMKGSQILGLMACHNLERQEARKR